MMRHHAKKTTRRPLVIKKETVRALDLPTLDVAELARVAGGTHTFIPRFTCRCTH